MARILRESARLRRGALRAHASIAVRFRQMAALDAGIFPSEPHFAQFSDADVN